VAVAARAADAREQRARLDPSTVVFDGTYVDAEITVGRDDVDPVEEVVHAHARP
jgi:hypothetical protein